MKSSLEKISGYTESFLRKHAVNETAEQYDHLAPLTGEFALHRNQSQADLYGMIDAVYSLYTIGKLEERTSRSSRQIWATRILSCQDESGWFSKLNERGHSREHATAYAIGALRLLEIESDETYTDKVQPLSDLLPILSDYDVFLEWIERLNFHLTVRDIRNKNLGWHYIWRSSHVGGGVPAAVGMLQQSVSEWWPQQVELEQWFQWYFDWLDTNVNHRTGYWQRAFWNTVYRKPTLIDMGGAVHFFWVYDAMGHPISSPEAVITSTLSLQKQTGLYKDYPFCIDLDGLFCLTRPYLQLSQGSQEQLRSRVHSSVESSFEAIVKAFNERPMEDNYSDSHGLPGALAALVECGKMPEFKYSDALAGWQHPLDAVWWL